jgi:hypothetical protein
MTDMAMPSASQKFPASYGISIPEELGGMRVMRHLIIT